jgi:hydroxymethylglutaryl-CoA reductase (NADPH)
MTERKRIPRSKNNDYHPDAIKKRQDFIAKETGAGLKHVKAFSFSPDMLPGNVENMLGAAQVPIGVAGPLLVKGEHAKGEFYVPLATTEGTLVASYNRGMRLLALSGGIKTTVVERYMQRAPVFHFENALDARKFGVWVDENFDSIKRAAETTTSIGKLSHIEQYGVGPIRFLRMNFTTGDAAGQNMCGKAAYAACEWIKRQYPDVNYRLAGGIDTDKKHSQLNTLHSRGARVVAEAVIPKAVLNDIMRVDGETLYKARQVSHIGSLLTGATNNGLHAANGLAAIFIATGQDAANIAESHAGLTYVDLKDNGDLYWSITLPSLIVATYGGGTGLATQRECLEIMDCYGNGKVEKFAEICAATVLAGDISLASAVVSGDWVSSHDKYGRNRP